MAKKTLLADVTSRITNTKPGFKNWFERLPEDARAELDAVRLAFDPKTHQKTAFARAVIAASRERGWKTGGEQAVLAWLNGSR